MRESQTCVSTGDLPEKHFAAAQAAEHPLGIDQDVEHGAAFGRGGIEAGLVFGEESFEVSRLFVREGFGFGVNAGFQGIEAGNGFSRQSART